GHIIDYQVQPIHESIRKELANIPGVRMGPDRGAYGVRFIHFQYQGLQLGIKSYDEPPPEIEYGIFDVKDRPVKEAGYDIFHSTEPTVLVSENFVMHFHKKTGDTIQINTPSGVVNARIVGVVV